MRMTSNEATYAIGQVGREGWAVRLVGKGEGPILSAIDKTPNKLLPAPAQLALDHAPRGWYDARTTSHQPKGLSHVARRKTQSQTRRVQDRRCQL